MMNTHVHLTKKEHYCKLDNETKNVTKMKQVSMTFYDDSMTILMTLSMTTTGIDHQSQRLLQ